MPEVRVENPTQIDRYLENLVKIWKLLVFKRCRPIQKKKRKSKKISQWLRGLNLLKIQWIPVFQPDWKTRDTQRQFTWKKKQI